MSTILLRAASLTSMKLPDLETLRKKTARLREREGNS